MPKVVDVPLGDELSGKTLTATRFEIPKPNLLGRHGDQEVRSAAARVSPDAQVSYNCGFSDETFTANLGSASDEIHTVALRASAHIGFKGRQQTSSVTYSVNVNYHNHCSAMTAGSDPAEAVRLFEKTLGQELDRRLNGLEVIRGSEVLAAVRAAVPGAHLMASHFETPRPNGMNSAREELIYHQGTNRITLVAERSDPFAEPRYSVIARQGSQNPGLGFDDKASAIAGFVEAIQGKGPLIIKDRDA